MVMWEGGMGGRGGRERCVGEIGGIGRMDRWEKEMGMRGGREMRVRGERERWEGERSQGKGSSPLIQED